MKIRAISIDWEGCCAEPGGGRVPWPLQKQLKLAQLLLKLWQETGIWFVINSGRQAPYIEAALQALGIITNEPSVCENGSILYYPLSRTFLVNPVITPEKERAFLEVRQTLIKLSEKLGGKRELGKEYMFSSCPPDGMGIEEYYEQIKAMVQRFIDDEIIEITHSQSAVDVTIAGVNKESGLEFWLAKTGLDLDEVAAIGDSRGDWPVLKRVALPLAPANATPETQKLVGERGGYVSPYPTVQGVIDCVAQVTENFRVRVWAERMIERISGAIPVESYTLLPERHL